jgi:non-heme chloroperoxidase
MPMIKVRDDASLYVKIWGQGRPVVLIHGWPLNADTWDAVALDLASKGFRAIAYDRRGFGRSDQTFSGYNYDGMSDDLADVMTATGATDDVTLIGFSMGGGEVARYMSRHGGKGIRSAALVSSVVPYMLKTADNPMGVPQEEFDKMAAGINADRPAFMKKFLNDFYGVGIMTAPVSDAVLDWSWGMCMQAGLRPTLACAHAFSSTDFRGDLAAFKVPTLIIHGTSDKTVPIDTSARQAVSGIRGAELIEYDGAPHGLFATHTDRLISDLTRFAAR